MTTTRTEDTLATVQFFNVGQGDSILVRLGTGQVILIDSNVSKSASSTEPPALRALKAIANQHGGQPKLDLLCLTHPDADHYRGLDEIIKWIDSAHGTLKSFITSSTPDPKRIREQVETIRKRIRLDGNRTHDQRVEDVAELNKRHNEYARVYDQVAKAIGWSDSHGLFQMANGFKEIRGFDPARLFILGPTSRTVRDHANAVMDDVIKSWLNQSDSLEVIESANAVSCVLWLVFPEASLSVMLTGDTTASAWTASLDSYDHGEDKKSFGFETLCDIVKAPHHGSRKSSSEELWKRVLKPNGYVAVSAGGHRGYGHPHPETIGHLRRGSAPFDLYCTTTCPHSSGDTGRLNCVEDSAYGDAAEAAGAQRPRSRPPVPFHGTYAFTLLKTGKIQAEAEYSPGPAACRYHGSAS